MTRKIIGLCGLAHCGKNTIANILVEKYNFKINSVGNRLKDTVATMFDLPRPLLEGDTEESRRWRETELNFWSAELGRPMTPRRLLQEVGTDCLRNILHQDIWLLTLKHQMQKDPETSWVISDIRFPNEINFIKDQPGGEIWQVRRGVLPDWYISARSDNLYGTSLMADKNIHESEWRWVQDDNFYDLIIDNNGSIQDMIHIIERDFDE